MAVDSKPTISEFSAIVRVVFGNILMGLAYAKWMQPDGIINGGVTSVAMILEKISNISIIYLSFALSGGLLLLCLIFLGKGNFFKSILSSLLYNLFFSLFYWWQINLQINLVVDFCLASLFIALGYYCCISANASTVGMDVIALILHKKNPRFNIAQGIRYLNWLVLAFGLFTYGLQSIIVGVAFSFVSSFLLAQLLRYETKYSVIKNEQ